MDKMKYDELLAAKIPGEESGIEVKTGICGFCGGKCFVDVYCKDGKVVKIEGNKTMPGANGRICVKGAAMKQALYNPFKRKKEITKSKTFSAKVYLPLLLQVTLVFLTLL